MSAVGRTRALLRAILRRGRMEREMREEMDAHIAQAAERYAARGLSWEEARAAARREFGHVESLREHARDARGGEWADALARDVKYAFRWFARTPLTSVVIVLTLALGIGFTSATFSGIDAVLTRPAPGVPDDPELVKIRGIADAYPFDRKLSWPELAAYAGLDETFASVVGWVNAGVAVDGGGEGAATSARGHFVTPNYFATLGVRLAAGAGFVQSRFADRHPAELTAVVSDAIANERFGGARNAVGRRIRVNGIDLTVVGVAPPRFAGPVQSGQTRNVWMPLSAWRVVAQAGEAAFDDPHAELFEAFARLRPGVSVEQALPAVRVVAARAAAAAKAAPRPPAPGENAAAPVVERHPTADVVRLRGVMEVGGMGKDVGPVVVMVTAIALLILLVCTTTVNSLLVGASAARRYEIGVRLALGASRRRVVRQLLTEVAILALAGAALGMVLFDVLGRSVELARDGFDLAPDWSSIAFTVAFALFTAVIAGLSPALHATRAGLAEVLKDNAAGTTGRSRLQRTFVVAQIAIAQPLMVGIAATLSSVMEEVRPVGNTSLRDQVVVAEFDTRAAVAAKAPDELPALVRRLNEVPGVQAAMPIGFGQGGARLELPAGAASRDTVPVGATVALYDAPAGYFEAVGARIVRGRAFVAADTALPVTPIVIGDSLASALFGASDPVGRRLVRPASGDARPAELEVVGVVRIDRESHFLESEPELLAAFVPFVRRGEGRVLIRTSGPAEALIPDMMAAAREAARSLPVVRMRTLSQADRAWRESRLGAVGVVAVCGFVALLLASVGLYALVGIAVGQRRREIGVRVALGAKAREVVGLFFRGGLRTTLLGLAIGMPLGVAGLTLLRSEAGLAWQGVALIAALVPLVVVGVASLASWLPARRAAGVDPMVALRAD